MQESYFKIEFADINLSTIWYDNRFNIPESTKDIANYNELSRSHSHPSYEVFFVTEGKLWLTTESEKFLCENSLVIIPPGLPHYTLTEKALINVIFFNIERGKEGSKPEIYEKLNTATKSAPTILPLNDDERFYLSHIAEAQNSDVLKIQQIPNFISVLFSEIFSRIVPTKTPTPKKSERYYAHKINLFLSKHYTEKIHLADLADELFLCPKQVTRIIKKEFNCSFNDLVMRCRMDIARMTLMRTDLEISQIASSVGYEYPNHFYTHFKKLYGMTPSEYRESKKQ